MAQIHQQFGNALGQIPHPSYPQHGWKGLVIKPALFAHINQTPFVPPTNPGLIAIYPQFASVAVMKMINSQFKIDKNFYQTFKNIKKALYNLLMKSVGLQYQASTTPGLSSWDPSMSILHILSHLDSTYGKPDAQTTHAKATMFGMRLQQNQTPESAFLRLEECQEVAILAENPYWDTQLITQAVLLLRQANIFPDKEFDDWGPMPYKTWASMKTYFQTAYTKRLKVISLSHTAGQHHMRSWQTQSATTLVLPPMVHSTLLQRRR